MMERTLASKAAGRLALGLALTAAAACAQAEVVYSNIPAALPGNLPSLGYQATSTSEFGDHIALAPGGRQLQTVTLTLSDWALASDYNSTAAGYDKSLTLNLYRFAGNAAAGPLIASQTLTAFIPWRPAADPTCAGGTAWRDASGACYNGLAFNVAFDFSSLGITLPDDLVVGLAFDTQSYGAHPTGVAGPSNSLNFALAGAPTVGTDVNPDGVFWNTSYQGFLTTGTAGVFGQDTAWSPYVPAIRIDASVPEPASLALVGVALLGAAVARRRRA